MDRGLNRRDMMKWASAVGVTAATAGTLGHAAAQTPEISG
jgi:hypothetical protein